MNLIAEKTYTLHRVQFGSLSIDVLLTFNHRKNLKISVHPDLRVTVDAPSERSVEEVLARVRNRVPWILKQKRYYDRFQPIQPERQFVSGESHLYLGKHYRLKISKSDTQSVRLKGGYFHVSLERPETKDHVKSTLLKWYKEHAYKLFTSRLNALYEKFSSMDLPLPKLNIKEMSTRWGSCSKGGIITLNLHLIKAPLNSIDYVIMHELCHLLEHNHTDKFYKLLAKYMPDWEKWKDRLEKVVIL